ncbi:MAG: N-6 DNA methylase [Sulfurimonas sp.]|jgi:predicted RNA methylase
MKAEHLYNIDLKHRPTKLELGAIYTPSILSDWVAITLNSFMQNSDKAILDPASGDGALLKPLSRICSNALIAVDINNNELSKVKDNVMNADNLNTYQLDTLMPCKKQKTLEYWKSFFIKKYIGAVISNPPWGSKIWQTNQQLHENGISLASGQYDAYELFMQIMIEAAPNNTLFAFIIPDSIFLSEHKKLRELILSTCKIHIISRLGEGFFENVNRGTCVLILEKGTADKRHYVKCMRLNKDWRMNILLENVSFSEAFENLFHNVLQHRFANNNELLFDIDILEKETAITKIDAIQKLVLTDYFRSGRGVELAKSGKVILCNNCGTVHPIPRKKDLVMCKCGVQTDVLDDNILKIIMSHEVEGSMPLIVGEDIKRYSCSSKRYIMKDIKGINYKNSNDFKKKKLLIRKTGIGINASIDDSGAYTNQVVFHYIPKEENGIPLFITEYVLGILSSRVLMAYYLQKYGDNEWRSHPYITQKIISQLPIPDIYQDDESWQIAQKIAILVKKKEKCTIEKSREHDIDIERLVVKLFRLTNKECKWVVDTLQNAQQLELIKTLAISDYKEIVAEQNEL